MDTGELLLAAIREHPAEDTPRLEYADWLQEHGPAGVVICHICGGRGGWDSMYHGRASPGYWCRCATCEGSGREPDAVGCRVRGIKWMMENPQNCWVCLCNDGPPGSCNVCKWMGDEAASIPRRTDGNTHYVVHRGFVNEVRLSLALFLEHAREMFGRHPITRVVLPGFVRGGFVFRTSNSHHNDIPREAWEELGLPRCESRDPDCTGRGTHAHMTEDELSARLVSHGRKLAGLPQLPAVYHAPGRNTTSG